MNTNVILPNLGFGMEEGRLIAWLKKPGETVKKGEPIAEIESDKATVELEAVVDGTLTETLYPPDSVVPVGTVLAHIQTGVETATDEPRALSTGPAEASGAESQRISPLARRMAAEQGIDLANVAGTGPGGRITRQDLQTLPSVEQVVGHKALAAPAVRKLARDNRIELRSIRGTGKDGHITRADVEAALAQMTQSAPIAEIPVPVPTSQPVGGRREVALSNMRRAIGKRLVQSMQDAPHFYVTAELDLTPALKQLPETIGLNALLLYLTVKTLKTIPELNATYEDGRLYQYDHVNLGIAVALSNGLISPVLHHADDYSLSGLAERAKDMITRARQNHLRPEELSEGTFTISNLGIVQQVERFTAIINPPQIAILAVGAAKPRPFVIDGGLHVRTTVHLTLSVDHRIADGMTAARFLEAFDGQLQASERHLM